MSGIGVSAKRLEDGQLLTGRGRFAADVSFPGELHMRIVRSPVAHGRLAGIDASEALGLEGVVAVWTGADTAELPPIDFRMTAMDVLKPYRQHVLARDFVRYVGDPVAAVFAEDAALAEDAAELVSADIEPLEVDIDPAGPAGEFVPGLSNAATVLEKAYGDLDAAFAAATHVVEVEVSVARQSGTPLETRGAIARYLPERGLTELHGAAKVPHQNRELLAEILGVGLDNIHLHEGHVGGGFGIRGELYPEDVLVCLAARRLGRPVKWIEDRLENLVAANHSRDQSYALRAAVDASGFVLGLDAAFTHNQGAYVRTHAATVPDLSCAMLPGPYLIPAYRVRGQIRLTNRTPGGTYRAPGRYESTFARERLMDAIAAKVGIDPVAVRHLNLVPADKIPFVRGLKTLGEEVVYDSADFAGLLDGFVRHFGLATIRREIERRRVAGECVGFGLGYFVEKSGLGPFGVARVEVGTDGAIEIVTGAASVGQGVETALAQICAETLPVDLGRVTVVHGQTDRIAEGRGAFASRVTVMTGSAVHLCAEKLRPRMVEIAARLLQAPAGVLALAEGRIAPRDEPGGPSVSFSEVAQAAAADGEPLVAEEKFLCEHMTYPYGIHGALVAVDEETGGVAVERICVGYDVGRAVNPVLIEGQIAGGAAQGIGGALFEEFIYDGAGQPLAATFVDYLLPTAREMAPVETLITEDAPSPINPLGVKGAGEAGINAVGAAIASALDDALGMPGAVTRLPASPARIRELIRRREGARKEPRRGGRGSV